MQILYLDDAGEPGDPDQKHFILAGIALFERQVHWLQTAMDGLAEGLGYGDSSDIEFHGSAILAGRGRRWRHTPKAERRTIIRDGLNAYRSLQGDWCLFGVVVDKQALSPEDPVEYAFEQLCSRFDLFLTRLHHKGNTQRGLIILDKSTKETRLQSLASGFKRHGHRWGVTWNQADVPFFVDSKATRLIQYADLVAYAMWRRFEKGDGEFFDTIADLFDREGSTIHGLHHFKGLDDSCDCPACNSPV